MKIYEALKEDFISYFDHCETRQMRFCEDTLQKKVIADQAHRYLQKGDEVSIDAGMSALIITDVVLYPISSFLRFLYLQKLETRLVDSIAIGVAFLIRGIFLAPFFVASLFSSPKHTEKKQVSNDLNLLLTKAPQAPKSSSGENPLNHHDLPTGTQEVVTPSAPSLELLKEAESDNEDPSIIELA